MGGAFEDERLKNFGARAAIQESQRLLLRWVVDDARGVFPPLTPILRREAMRVADHPRQPCWACRNDSFLADIQGLDLANVSDDRDGV
jgi:hypothetical protein